MPEIYMAMFYFYTNVLEYSPSFLGTLKMVYSIATLVGLLIYNLFLKNVDFKK